MCIIDNKQRYLTESQKEILQRLADIVVDEMELRLSARNLLRNVSTHLKNVSEVMEEMPVAVKTPKVETLLASSKKLVQTIGGQLNNPKLN